MFSLKKIDIFLLVFLSVIAVSLLGVYQLILNPSIFNLLLNMELISDSKSTLKFIIVLFYLLLFLFFLLLAIFFVRLLLNIFNNLNKS